MANRVTGRNARSLIGDGLRAAIRPGKLGRLLTGDPAAWRMARAVGGRAMKALRKRLHSNADTAVARELRKLLKRGVRTMMVFSAGDAGLSESAHQFGPNLGLVGASKHLRFEIIEGASHTLAELRSRNELTRLVDDFLAPWAASEAREARAA